ncbi:hypothetical protein [Pseudoclavibacter sp. RFBA6]|uniref:hypothetical protein n=1 Tax=Pseudoclavibacter sp. RFBA6 TaxID=2080573 RepID=UPI000CE831CA|nr:hypothetical protein [Pseudoclavibacter sp. RFBA6]PPG42691.1 hypothetical protein C5C17_02460 [Pseudoclavibacter sp. RFBA6]
MDHDPDSAAGAITDHSSSLQVPEQAVRAMHVQLDAIIAQHATSDAVTKELAFQLALEPFGAPATELDESIEDSHILGAALLNQGWLAGQLAQATGTDLETVVSNLRDFINRIEQ